jgi:hypothetical protein
VVSALMVPLTVIVSRAETAGQVRTNASGATKASGTT